jgi:hypothetical protein
LPGEGEADWWGTAQDTNSSRLLNKVDFHKLALKLYLITFQMLDYEDVDLVVYSGDLITGNNVHNNATAYWKELLLPASKRGLSFVPALTASILR